MGCALLQSAGGMLGVVATKNIRSDFGRMLYPFPGLQAFCVPLLGIGPAAGPGAEVSQASRYLRQGIECLRIGLRAGSGGGGNANQGAMSKLFLPCLISMTQKNTPPNPPPRPLTQHPQKHT